MHHDHMVALHTVRDLGLRVKPADTALVEVSIHPPFTDIRTVGLLIEGEGMPFELGAQHCHSDDEGAFTGEVSAPMLARLGVRYVIVGHSERRRLFAMTDEQVAATMRAVLRHSMIPVLCVGETAEERDAGTTERRLGAQLESALGSLTSDEMTTLVIAYEPIWAIGTGRAATPVDAADAAAFIRMAVVSAGGPPAGGGGLPGRTGHRRPAGWRGEPAGGRLCRGHPGGRWLLPFSCCHLSAIACLRLRPA